MCCVLERKRKKKKEKERKLRILSVVFYWHSLCSVQMWWEPCLSAVLICDWMQTC